MKKVLSVILAVVLICSLSVSAFAAADVNKSVTAKPAPELVVPNVANPNIVAQILKGETVIHDVLASELIITPYHKADSAPHAIITDMLKDAYTEITSIDSVGELHDALDALAKKINKDYTADNLVVTDLFDIYLTGEAEDHHDAHDEHYLRVTFKTGIAADAQAPIVLYNCTGDKWDVVDAANVVNNGDGTLTIEFHDLCPVVFLSAVDKETPDTGDSTNAFLWGGVAVVAAAGCVLLSVFVFKKREEDTVA